MQQPQLRALITGWLGDRPGDIDLIVVRDDDTTRRGERIVRFERTVTTGPQSRRHADWIGAFVFNRSGRLIASSAPKAHRSPDEPAPTPGIPGLLVPTPKRAPPLLSPPT